MDLAVAHLPSASVGTAMEIWLVYEKRVPVYAIAPMSGSWIRLFSDCQSAFPQTWQRLRTSSPAVDWTSPTLDTGVPVG